MEKQHLVSLYNNPDEKESPHRLEAAYCFKTSLPQYNNQPFNLFIHVWMCIGLQNLFAYFILFCPPSPESEVHFIIKIKMKAVQCYYYTYFHIWL